MMEVLTNATMAIVLQYINVSHQHIGHLKPTQFYMSSISQLKKRWERGTE